MKKYYFPDGSEIMKKKPKNSSWVSINLTEFTLKEKMKEFGTKTIKDFLVLVFMDFFLEINKSDRLELKVRN